MKKYSRLLSLVLRHKPEEIGLTLDKHGWVTVRELIKAVKTRHSDFSIAMLDEIVKTNDKQRFEYDITGTKIRACQGHSVNIDLGLVAVEPPVELYHGTAKDNLPSIYHSGIEKRSRTHVQLSVDMVTANEVGARHGKPVIIIIAALAMHKDGYAFYLSTNNVWLTDYVPREYIVLSGQMVSLGDQSIHNEAERYIDPLRDLAK